MDRWHIDPAEPTRILDADGVCVATTRVYGRAGTGHDAFNSDAARASHIVRLHNEDDDATSDAASTMRGQTTMPMVGKNMDRKRNKRRRQLSGAHTADSWNSAHPIGTAVRYWPVYPPIESVPPIDTTTRTTAWTLGDGSVVVSIVGKSGGVHLSHVEVIV